MARIICISKYPPLEGGIAAKTYWLCRALAERGHTVHVVTDREVADADYCAASSKDQAATENLHVHRPTEEIPWHIPNDPHRALSLLNTALEVVDRYGADVIDTGYLIPYGLVGCLAGQVTGIPYLLRHGGSDLNKFMDKGIWANLITKAFNGAGAVITEKDRCESFRGLSKRVIAIPPYVPDPAFFKPAAGERSKPTLALIGKANYYWRHKGWHRAIDIMQSLGDRFRYLVVSQGVGLKDFRKYADGRIASAIEWREFVHPAEMPELLQSVSGVFAFQQDLPFPAFSNVVVEALYCNVGVITDSPRVGQSLIAEGLIEEADLSHILVITSDESGKAAERIIDHFTRSVPGMVGAGQRNAAYAAYLNRNEEAILSVSRIDLRDGR